jgi:hypothetical protein
VDGATQLLAIADPDDDGSTRECAVVNADDHGVRAQSPRGGHARSFRWLAKGLSTAARVEIMRQCER